MRIVYDPAADAAYVYLRTPRPGDVAGTLECSGPARARKSAAGVQVDGVMLDFSKDGRLLGVEVLGAWDRLPAEALAEAELPAEGPDPGCRHEWRESRKVLASLPPKKIRTCARCGASQTRPVGEPWE